MLFQLKIVKIVTICTSLGQVIISDPLITEGECNSKFEKKSLTTFIF